VARRLPGTLRDDALRLAVDHLPPGAERARAWELLGRRLREAGAHDEAASAAREALALEPDDPRALWLDALGRDDREAMAAGLDDALDEAVRAGKPHRVGELLTAWLWACPTASDASWARLQAWALPTDSVGLPPLASVVDHPRRRRARLQALVGT